MFIQGNSTFDLFALRFHFVAHRTVQFPSEVGNFFRGQFGKALYRRRKDAFTRLLRPQLAGGPSGLRDAPRSFVFRARHLNGALISAGEKFHVGLNLFETRFLNFDLIRDTLAEMVKENLGAEFSVMEGKELLRMPLESDCEASRLRIRFLTATELKGGSPADFGALLARIRDRVSMLRALYGPGPLAIDFKALGERAFTVRTTRCDLEYIDLERVSRTSGQRHGIGGFIGLAEYEGSLGEFLPYLEIARFTGVGRHTVWGNGEIAIETF